MQAIKNYILSQNKGRAMSLALVLELALNMGEWNSSHPAICGKVETLSESDSFVSLSSLLADALANETREKPRTTLTVCDVTKPVTYWLAELDKLDPKLKKGMAFGGNRHRSVGFGLRCIATGSTELFGTIPKAYDNDKSLRALSVAENLSQLSGRRAGNLEIWESVKTLTPEFLAKVGVESVMSIGRNPFGAFFNLKDGLKQKFHYMSKCLHLGVTDETIVGGLSLNHSEWCQVLKAVEAAPVIADGNGEDIAAAAEIEKWLTEKSNKDKPLTPAQLLKLESKAANMPQIVDFITAIRTGDYESAVVSLRDFAGIEGLSE